MNAACAQINLARHLHAAQSDAMNHSLAKIVSSMQMETPAETLTCQTTCQRNGKIHSGPATGQAYQDIHPVVQAAAAAGTPAAAGQTVAAGSQRIPNSWAKALHAYIKNLKMFASATTPKMPSTWKHALESNSCAVRFPYPY